MSRLSRLLSKIAIPTPQTLPDVKKPGEGQSPVRSPFGYLLIARALLT